MMQTPVEGELFVTVVEGAPSRAPLSSPARPRAEGSSSRSLPPLPIPRSPPFSDALPRIPLFNLTEPLFVTSLLH